MCEHPRQGRVAYGDRGLDELSEDVRQRPGLHHDHEVPRQAHRGGARVAVIPDGAGPARLAR